MAHKEQNTRQITETVLEAIKFRMHNNYGRFAIDSLDVLIQHHIPEEMTMYLQTRILGQHNIQKYTVWVETPLNWWEHFKLDKLPEWYVKKYPVRYKRTNQTVEFDHMALMPDINISPEHGRVVMHTQPVATACYSQITKQD